MLDDIEVIILVGGKGTRLSSVISDIPKPLAPIQQKPFLSYLIDYCYRQGFRHFCLSAGYMADKIVHFAAAKANTNLRIRIQREESPLGTGGATRDAIQTSCFSRFLVLNGDTFFTADNTILIDTCNAKGSFGLGLRYTTNGTRYGSVKIDSNYSIQSFKEKKPGISEGYINAGIYYFTDKIIDNLPAQPCSLEEDIFPLLVEQKSLIGIPLGGQFIDIGIPEDFYRAQYNIPMWNIQKPKKCLFLDRDGIVIEDHGYVHKTEDVHLTPHIISLIQTANRLGWLTIIVTNQAGIGRGYFDEATYHQCEQYIHQLLNKNGCHITDTFMCPFHEEAGIGPYKRPSLQRKPEPGMLLQAMEKYPISTRCSIMVGDKTSDQIRLPGLVSYILCNRKYPFKGRTPKYVINSLTELQTQIGVSHDNKPTLRGDACSSSPELN
ncbi:MAG: HAD-IIIA family hydrolase [Zetaproteobacteria bacterium]|nr:HAD-IIIA family hydrolase [Zetaproteobacteria bacterium]